jgi:hypothetical protein
VIIGSRGHGRLAGLLLGSVAQKVITQPPCHGRALTCSVAGTPR